MKSLIAPLLVVVGIGIPTMLGIIPPFIGVPAMLAVILIKDIIFMVLSRGMPMAMISQRLLGGLLWGVYRRGEIDVDRFQPLMGTVQTKKSGSFNVMAERIVRIGGVPIGLAPEKVGYNVGLDHLALIDELKRRGIHEISEIIDANEYGQFLNFKDDERIKDLWDIPEEFLDKKLDLSTIQTKEQLAALVKQLEADAKKPRNDQLDLSSMDEFYRFTTVASNPYHNEARIKMGIAQAVTGKAGTSPVLILAIAAIIIVGIIAAMSILGGGNGAPEAVQQSSNVIPAMIPV